MRMLAFSFAKVSKPLTSEIRHRIMFKGISPERENIMGAHLFYMISDKKKAAEFNNVMAETEIGKRLIKANSFCGVNDESDIEIAKEKYPSLVSFYQEHLGQGDFKASGISEEEIETAGCKTLEEYFDLITEYFELAQTKFKMWFAARSCAFNIHETYFSVNQMKRITKNGKRLKPSKTDPEKTEQLLKLFK